VPADKVLLTDAKLRKDIVQQIVGIHLTGNLRKVINGFAYVDGKQVTCEPAIET
jgi:hypothetical protein